LEQQGKFKSISPVGSSFALALTNSTSKCAITEDEVDSDDASYIDSEALRISISKRLSTIKGPAPRKNATICSKKTNASEPIEDNLRDLVKLSTYLMYFRQGASIPGLVYLCILVLVGQVLSIMTDYWLSIWTTNSNTYIVEDFYNPTIYVCLSMLLLAAASLRSISFFFVSVSASNSLFNSMTTAVLETSLHFFDTNSEGAILQYYNR
jgi:hypothetical protein